MLNHLVYFTHGRAPLPNALVEDLLDRSGRGRPRTDRAIVPEPAGDWRALALDAKATAQ